MSSGGERYVTRQEFYGVLVGIAAMESCLLSATEPTATLAFKVVIAATLTFQILLFGFLSLRERSGKRTNEAPN